MQKPKLVSKSKKISIIGGGTGTYTLLSGLKAASNLDISAIVTMADDGGSNKVLRDEFGLLPTSGVRQSMVALSKDQTVLRKLFSYRYSQGLGIAGMTFGNLFMAALSDIFGNQQTAIKETCKLLRVKGKILPVSYEQTTLLATYQDGTEVLGEHFIDISNPQVSRQRIISLRTLPQVNLDHEARQAITKADFLVLGPGDLYTNTIANLIVKGVREAIEVSKAQVIFVMNLMTKAGETYNYRASDFLADLSKYLNPVKITHVLLNSDTEINPKLLKSYQSEDSSLVVDDLGVTWQHARVIRTPVRSYRRFIPERGDKLMRSMVRHDPDLLATALLRIFSGKI